MNLDLGDKVALVTGASIGIGRAIARGLAAEGVRVVAVARRGELLETLAEEIVGDGGPRPALVVQDIMAEDAAARLRDAAVAAFGRVDILVNNAGSSVPVPFDAPDSAWTEPLTLCYTRPRQIAHAVLPGMIDRRWAGSSTSPGKASPSGWPPPARPRRRCIPGPSRCRARSAATGSP